MIIETVARKKSLLVPSDIRADRYAALAGEEVVLSGYHVNHRSCVEDLLVHINNFDLSRASGILILTDDSLPDMIGRLGDVFNVNRFTPPEHGRDVANALQATLARSLRTFRYLMTRFRDLKYQQIMRLPLRNFVAPEIAVLRAVCNDTINKANFGRELDRSLKAIRQRQSPKKASSYQDIYLVDDAKKHFSLAYEIHAKADTARPPHESLCILRNQFRFGCGFDGSRHFNVSYDGDLRMTDEYIDCHAEKRKGTGAKHLNMFTNDFF